MNLDTILSALLPKKEADQTLTFVLLRQYAILQVLQESDINNHNQQSVNVVAELKTLLQPSSFQEESIKTYNKLLFCTQFLYQQAKRNKTSIDIPLSSLFDFTLHIASNWRKTNNYFLCKTLTKLLIQQNQGISLIQQSLNSKKILQEIIIPFYASLQDNVEHGDIENSHENLLLNLKSRFELAASLVCLCVRKDTIEQNMPQILGLIDEVFNVYIWNSNMQDTFQEIVESQNLQKYILKNQYSIKFFLKVRETIFTFFRLLFQSDKRLRDIISQQFSAKYLSLSKESQSHTQLNTQEYKQHQHFLLGQESIKFIELIFSNQKYDLSSSLITSSSFWNDLRMTLEVYDNPEAQKQAINSLQGVLDAIQLRLNEKDIKSDKSLFEAGSTYIKKYKAFVDIYTTLDSFAVHLIKSLWPQLTKFFEKDLFNAESITSKIPILAELDSKWPVIILFRKAIYHNNQSIVKSCVKSFLKMDSVDIDLLQDLIYDHAVPILNNSIFYNDASLDADSKFYAVVRQFFLTSYEKLFKRIEQELVDQKKEASFHEIKLELYNHHLRRLLRSICKHIAHPQAISAFFSIFPQLTEVSTFMRPEESKILIEFTNRCYSRSNLRKRTIFARAVMIMIMRHLDIHSFNDESIFELILEFPEQTFEWKSVFEFNKNKWLENTLSNESQAELIQEMNKSYFYKQKLLLFLICNCNHINIYSFWNQQLSTSFQNLTISSQERASAFNNLLKLSNILLDIPLFSHSLEKIKSANESFYQANMQQIDFFCSFLKPGSIQEVVSNYLFENKLRDIYSNSYRPNQENIQSLIHLNQLIKVFKYSQEMKSFSLSLNTISSDLISYLELQIQQQAEQQNTQEKDNFQVILETVSQLAYISVNTDLLQPASKLQNALGKLTNKLFDQLNKAVTSPSDEGEGNLAIANTELLTKICFSQLEVIEESIKKGGEQNLYIDETIFKLGLILAKNISVYSSQLQGFIALSSKRGFLSKSNALLCGLLCLLSVSSELTEDKQFKEIVQFVVEESIQLSDVFDGNRLELLFKMLRRVYNPYIISTIKQENKEVVIQQLSQLFKLNLQQNLLESSLSIPTFKSVNSFFDWALDPLLFENEYILKSNVLQEFVKQALKGGENFWLIQRKTVDQLFVVFFQKPEIIKYFKKTVYRLIKMSEYRGFDSGVELFKEELEIPYVNEIKKKSKNETEYFGAYPRFVILKLLENICQWAIQYSQSKEGESDEIEKKKFLNIATFMIEFTFEIFERSFSKKYLKSRNSLLPCTKHYNNKLRTWQSLCVIKEFFCHQVLAKVEEISSGLGEKPILESQIVKDLKDKVWGIMDHNNQINIRQYIEIFTLHLYDQFPHAFEQNIIDGLQEKNNRSQLAIPLVFVKKK